MPKELESFADPYQLLAFRSIRGGERTGEKGIPKKTPLRVRHTVRDTVSRRMEVDEEIMRQVAHDLGKDPEKWPTDVDAIPVYVYSDTVVGEDGVIFLERALYSSRGRLCGSAAGDPMAHQTVDVDAYARSKGKKIQSLGQPRDIECSQDCPLWLSTEQMAKGEKSDCKWRAIVTVQLQSRPRYPSPTLFRTGGVNSIRVMIASLRAIKKVTGGILTGIPLVLRLGHLDKRDAGGKNRRIPVVTFDFMGTMQDLRTAARREMDSRTLIEGGEIKGIGNRTLENDEDVYEPMVDEEPVADDLEIRSKIALIYRRLEIPPARQRLIEQRNGGKLEKVLEDLKTMVPDDFDPGPGTVGEEKSETAIFDDDLDFVD